MSKRICALLISLSFLFICNIAHAQIIDSTFYEWTIYEIGSQENINKKCYMVNYPVKTVSDHNSRNRPYMMITRYQDGRIEELMVYSGFEYKIHSKVMVAIDNKKFLLTTNKDKAWTKNKGEDVIIIQNLINSATMRVRADSSIATFAVDEYSLKGIAKAYNRLRKICS